MSHDGNPPPASPAPPFGDWRDKDDLEIDFDTSEIKSERDLTYNGPPPEAIDTEPYDPNDGEYYDEDEDLNYGS